MLSIGFILGATVLKIHKTAISAVNDMHSKPVMSLIYKEGLLPGCSAYNSVHIYNHEMQEPLEEETLTTQMTEC